MEWEQGWKNPAGKQLTKGKFSDFLAAGAPQGGDKGWHWMKSCRAQGSHRASFLLYPVLVAPWQAFSLPA